MNHYRIGVKGPASQVHLLVALLHRTLAPYRFEVVGMVDTSLVEPNVSDWGPNWETLCRVLNVPLQTTLERCHGELSWGTKLSGQLDGFVPFGDLGLSIAQQELPQGIFRLLATDSEHRFEDFSVAAQAAMQGRLLRPMNVKPEWQHTLQFGAILDTQAMVKWLEGLNSGFGLSICSCNGQQDAHAIHSSLGECDLYIDLRSVSQLDGKALWQEHITSCPVRPLQEIKIGEDGCEVDYFCHGQRFRYQSERANQNQPWQGEVRWQNHQLTITTPTGGLMGMGNHLWFEAIWRFLDVLCLDPHAKHLHTQYQLHMQRFIAEQGQFYRTLFSAGAQPSEQSQLFRAAGRLMVSETDAIRPVQWYGLFAALHDLPQQHSVALSSTSDPQLGQILKALAMHISNWVKQMPDYSQERDAWLTSQHSGAVQ